MRESSCDLADSNVGSEARARKPAKDFARIETAKSRTRLPSKACQLDFAAEGMWFTDANTFDRPRWLVEQTDNIYAKVDPFFEKRPMSRQPAAADQGN